MSQPSSTDKAPITDKSTDDQSNSWGSFRRPGEAAPTREGTPAPVPAPVAQVLQRGPAPHVYPSTLDLERSVGPKGRHSYSTATKLRVMDYTRLRCNDGGLVGNRGATTGLGQGLCPQPERLKYVWFSVRVCLFCCCCAKRKPIHIPGVKFPTSYVKHAFACFINNSISHTQMTCQPGPGAFTLKMMGGHLL